jgi:hypothetical protein
MISVVAAFALLQQPLCSAVNLSRCVRFLYPRSILPAVPIHFTRESQPFFKTEVIYYGDATR